MKNAELFMEMAYASITLVKAYLMQDPANSKRSLYSAKLHLKSILKKAEVSSLAFVVWVRGALFSPTPLLRSSSRERKHINFWKRHY